MLDTALAIILKTVLYASALSASGIVLCAATLRLPIEMCERNLIRLAAIISALSAVANLVLLFIRLGGDLDAPTLGAIFGEPVGLSLIVQAVAAIVLSVRTGGGWVSRCAGFLLATAFGMTGHAPAQNVWLGFIVAAHVLLAAWWVGGLWILHTHRGRPDLADYVGRFSRLAVWTVAGLVLAGCALAVALLGIDIDFTSPYVDWLGLKLFIVANLLGIATLNRFLLTRRLRHDPTAAIRLATSVRIELALLLAVAAVVAGMTTLSMPDRKPAVSAALAPPIHAGDLTISHYVMRASLGNVPTSAIYLQVDNNAGTPDRLVSAACDCAERTTLHLMRMQGDMMIMADVGDGIVIPPHGRMRLEPMGGHVMLEGTKHRLVGGSHEKVTLHFEHAGTVTIDVPVVDGSLDR